MKSITLNVPEVVNEVQVAEKPLQVAEWFAAKKFKEWYQPQFFPAA